MSAYTLQPVGFIRSTLKTRQAAPRQGAEGAPDAWLEIEPRFAEALLGMEVRHGESVLRRIGHELIVITSMHEARRDVLQNHPRGDESRLLTGVFYTPHRATERARAAPVINGHSRAQPKSIEVLHSYT